MGLAREAGEGKADCRTHSSQGCAATTTSTSSDSTAAEATAAETTAASAASTAVGARRASLRIIGSIEAKEKEKGGDKVSLITTYKAKVEDELNSICSDILALLDDKLIAKSTGAAEAQVFYLKMKGDYYRYIAEYKTDDAKSAASNSAHDAYKAAMEVRWLNSATSDC